MKYIPISEAAFILRMKPINHNTFKSFRKSGSVRFKTPDNPTTNQKYLYCKEDIEEIAKRKFSNKPEWLPVGSDGFK